MTDKSLSALLANAKKYTWWFSMGHNPSNISVLAFSLEDARQEVLAKLRKISYLSPEYKRIHAELWKHKYNSPEYIALEKQRDALYKQLNIDANIGCYCDDLFEYTPTALVRCGETTLEKFLSETEPQVSEIKTMAVYSCLDG
jgi:hypothetical protein